MNKNLAIRLYLYSLIGFIILAPTSINTMISFSIGRVEFRLENIIIIISNIIFFVSFFLVGKIRLNLIDKLYILFISLFILLGLINSMQNSSKFINLLLNINNLINPFFIYLYIKKRKDRQKIFNTAIFIGILISVQVFISVFVGEEITNVMGWDSSAVGGYGAIFRVRTSIGAATVTGLFLLIVFFLSLSCGIKNKIIIGIPLIASLLTISRSVILGVTVFSFITVILLSKKIRKISFWKNKKNIYTIIFIAVTIMFFVNTEVFSTIIQRFDKKQSSASNSERIELIKESTNLISNNIIIGTGLGSGYERVNHLSLNGILRNPHNSSIAILLEGGIFIYMIYLMIYFSYIKMGIKKNKIASISIFIFIFILSNFEAFYLSNIEIMIYLWLIISIIDGKEMNLEK